LESRSIFQKNKLRIIAFFLGTIVCWIVLWYVGYVGPGEGSIKRYETAVEAKLKNEELPKNIECSSKDNLIILKDEAEQLYLYEYNKETKLPEIKKNYPYLFWVNTIGAVFYAGLAYYIFSIFWRICKFTNNTFKRIFCKGR
jgi:hypothetical protein